MEKGDRVGAGQPLISWNPENVRAAGHSAVVPVVALDAPAGALSELLADGRITVGEQLYGWS